MPETHLCRWPGCNTHVALKLWGCKRHWFNLPKAIRDRICATYREGQELTLDPSEEYMEADAEARRFAYDVQPFCSHDYAEGGGD